LFTVAESTPWALKLKLNLGSESQGPRQADTSRTIAQIRRRVQLDSRIGRAKQFPTKQAQTQV
jgi:hypothetical protein